MQHSIFLTWSNGGQPVQGTINTTADGEENREITVPAATSNHAVIFALDISQAKSIFIKSDQDVLLETNSSSAPDDAINLKAGKPIMWVAGLDVDNFFSADITALYLTNAGSSAATVNICVLLDSTL